MQSIIAACPKNLNGYTLTFQFADGTYTGAFFTFVNFKNGGVSVQGNMSESGAHTNQAVIFDNSASTIESDFISIEDCICSFYVLNAKLILNNTLSRRGVVTVRSICSLYFFRNYVKCNSLPASNIYPTAILAEGLVAARVEDSYFEALHVALNVLHNAHVFSDNNPSIGTDNRYAFAVYYGAVISKGSGSQPSGAVSADHGGIIR
jgi:hypothetical protein